jgi:alkylhydroperoxidase family enzyme
MLPVWEDAPFYTAQERAALALTESVTRLSETHAPEPVVAEALNVLGEQKTAAIL